MEMDWVARGLHVGSEFVGFDGFLNLAVKRVPRFSVSPVGVVLGRQGLEGGRWPACFG